MVGLNESISLVREFQGPLRDAGSGNPTAAGNEFRAQRPSIPPAPFFQGFAAVGNQMSFLFPHPFMPPAPGAGFGPSTSRKGPRNEPSKNA